MSDENKPDLLLNWKGRYVHPAFWICTGFGSGLIRPAPGTWGSLAALLFAIAVINNSMSGLPLTLMIIVATLAGIYCANIWEKHTGSHDDGRIVIDEFAGMWLAMLPLTIAGLYTPTNVCLSFALFRFFDIIKPWPIGWLDKHVSGGIGVMIDDVIAGIFAALSLIVIIIFAVKVLHV